MKRICLFSAWGVLFVLCAVLGFVREPQGLDRILAIACAVLFFLPGALLLTDAAHTADARTAKLVLALSAGSLTVTLVLIVGNLMSVLWPESVGNVLHGLLAVLSTPMFCGQYWVLSLLLWACLLSGSVVVLRGLRRR